MDKYLPLWIMSIFVPVLATPCICFGLKIIALEREYHVDGIITEWLLNLFSWHIMCLKIEECLIGNLLLDYLKSIKWQHDEESISIIICSLDVVSNSYVDIFWLSILSLFYILCSKKSRGRFLEVSIICVFLSTMFIIFYCWRIGVFTN